LYDKQEIQTDKLLAKISIKDKQLMQKIFSEFSDGYSRFNVFYTSYLRAKRNSYANDLNNWDSNGLY